MSHILKFMNMYEADLCGHNFVQLTPVCIPVYRFQRARLTKRGDMISDWQQILNNICYFYGIKILLTIHFSKVILTIEPHFCILANIVIFLNTGNVY